MGMQMLLARHQMLREEKYSINRILLCIAIFHTHGIDSKIGGARHGSCTKGESATSRLRKPHIAGQKAVLGGLQTDRVRAGMELFHRVPQLRPRFQRSEDHSALK
jgi:hypothetical protein